MGSWESQGSGQRRKIAEDGGSCEPQQGAWALSKRREDQGSFTDFIGSLLTRLGCCRIKTTKWEQEKVVKFYQVSRECLPWANSSLHLSLLVLLEALIQSRQGSKGIEAGTSTLLLSLKILGQVLLSCGDTESPT